MVKILQHLKILEMWYLRHAEYHAKNRTSLCDLDQETLFFWLTPYFGYDGCEDNVRTFLAACLGGSGAALASLLCVRLGFWRHHGFRRSWRHSGALIFSRRRSWRRSSSLGLEAIVRPGPCETWIFAFSWRQLLAYTPWTESNVKK